MKLPIILSALVLSTTLQADDAPKVEGFTFKQTVGGMTEYQLDANGLRVLLKAEKSAPVVTFMVTYHVGSRLNRSVPLNIKCSSKCVAPVVPVTSFRDPT